MRPLTPRQADILRLARHEGRVDVESLAASFDVTPQTIRKDLNELCRLQELQRVHGGAVYPSSTANIEYLLRRDMASSSKQHIGEAAARLIPSDASLIVNIGTTTEQVAQALKRHEGLMVVTNNLNVAIILNDAPAVDVVVAGGILRKSDGGIVDAAAIDFIKQFKTDFAIVGASAIDEEGWMLDFDYREVRVAQTILRQARQRILVADSMKFGRPAPVKIAHLSEIDVFVTNQSPPKAIRDICHEADVRLEICGDAADLENEAVTA
jgi:DeoR family glycerol-3-phosphate regulon repressor